jgi:hypothetical protein
VAEVVRQRVAVVAAMPPGVEVVAAVPPGVEEAAVAWPGAEEEVVPPGAAVARLGTELVGNVEPRPRSPVPFRAR